jgi:hypothetical protein
MNTVAGGIDPPLVVDGDGAAFPVNPKPSGTVQTRDIRARGARCTGRTWGGACTTGSSGAARTAITARAGAASTASATHADAIYRHDSDAVRTDARRGDVAEIGDRYIGGSAAFTVTSRAAIAASARGAITAGTAGATITANGFDGGGGSAASAARTAIASITACRITAGAAITAGAGSAD